jgi:histidinol phosphatase-like PHP family hydrolase
MDYSKPDTNAIIGALLRDMASIQSAKQSGLGYKRAAHMVLGLETPIESLVLADGSLQKIPNVGPKSETIILEVLKTGASPTVERAVKESGKTANVAAARARREHYLSRAQVMAALNDASLSGPAVADYRGDLQLHSTYSDGTQTLDELVQAAFARNYDYCAITDHSYGLPIARGMSMAKLAEQHADIDRINREYDGRFRLIKGVEANIRPDGSIDMSADELAQLEFVLVAPHAALRSEDDQTIRMITALTTPGVHVLGHPRGRQYGTRFGVHANWDDVFIAAAHFGVAIEIDGDPARQDLDFLMIKRAVDAGCLIALDSDAHSPIELRHSEFAIAHARLAGVPTDRVINCWPTDRFVDWLESR